MAAYIEARDFATVKVREAKLLYEKNIALTAKTDSKVFF